MPVQSYADVSFLVPKWPICTEQNFFDHYYYFYLPIGLFHCVKFKKILKADLELLGRAISGPKMVHLPQKKLFWKKLIISHIHLPTGPFY